jgi:hypothetical protein
MSANSNFAELFEEETLSYKQLLFDPNNPRLFGEKSATGWRVIIPENQIRDQRVQDRVFQEILRTCDVQPIHDSILEVGFIPIDKIVVKQIYDDIYVVVEGNRRLAAIKLIIEESTRGEITISKELMEQFMSLPVMKYVGTEEQFTRDNYILQGMRHIAGIKSWGPFERARAVQTLKESGKTSEDISKLLFLKMTDINRILRTMSVLEQFKTDEIYGSFSSPEHYTHMYELVTRPKIREWLDWNSTTMKLENVERFREILSWIVDPEEKKIKQSMDLRGLPVILDTPGALEFLRRPGVTIEEAYAFTLKIEVTLGVAQFKGKLENMLKDLESLPSQLMRERSTLEILERIKTILEQRIAESRLLSSMGERPEEISDA